MNDLQILLISAGVILIVVVLAYNGWQEWRARRSMQEDASEDRHDVLMQQQEPVMRREPSMQVDQDARPETEENTEIDVLCEAVIDINLLNPQKGEKISQALAGLSQACSKPVRVFFNGSDGIHKTQMKRDGEYNLVQLAVLLANRKGPLTGIDWSHLWSFAQNVADKLDATLEAPDQADVIKRAEQLDALCADMDAQVGLILQLEKALGIKEIGEIAARAGFINKHGNWVLLAENNTPRFTLLIDQQSDEAVHRVDLLLDVPNSMPDNQAFSNMVGVGRELAQHMNAHVLDDQGRTFQDSSAAAIDQQLNDLYDKLDNAGFVAGTARAARVFA